jgi:hypothetical protein
MGKAVMGEYAEMIIDGFVDQYTGEVIDGHSPGYPRSKARKKRGYGKSDGEFMCKKCGRHFRSEKAVADHTEDMHTVEGQERRRKQLSSY